MSPESLDPAVAALVDEHVQSVEAAPSEGARHGELGLVYEANLLWPEARDCFAAASRLQPEESLWRFHLALALREAGDPEAGLGTLREVAREAPRFAPAQERLGRGLLEIGDLEGAERAFEQVVELAPRAPEGWIGLADVHLNLRDFERAAGLLEQAAELDPLDRGVRYRLGLAYRGLGRRGEAEALLSEGAGAAERHMPDPFTPRLERYTVHLSARLEEAGGALATGRARAAVEILEDCRATHPRNVTVLNDLAVAYLRAGDNNSALTALEQARALDEGRFSTFLNLAAWAQRSGRPEEALEYALAAVARGPDRAATHLTAARAQRRVGDLEAAAQSLEKAAALDPSDPYSRLALAGLYESLGRPEDAVRVYRAMTEVWAEEAVPWLGLAGALLATGDTDGAAAALAAGERLAPEHPDLPELKRRLVVAGDRS